MGMAQLPMKKVLFWSPQKQPEISASFLRDFQVLGASLAVITSPLTLDVNGNVYVMYRMKNVSLGL